MNTLPTSWLQWQRPDHGLTRTVQAAASLAACVLHSHPHTGSTAATAAQSGKGSAQLMAPFLTRPAAASLYACKLRINLPADSTAATAAASVDAIIEPKRAT